MKGTIAFVASEIVPFLGATKILTKSVIYANVYLFV